MRLVMGGLLLLVESVYHQLNLLSSMDLQKYQHDIVVQILDCSIASSYFKCQIKISSGME